MRFTKDFIKTFEWRGKPLKLGSVLPESKSLIAASLKDMSRDSIRHRFFGHKNGFSEKELKHLTEIDGLDHFAYGIVENLPQEKGVAIVRMVRDDHSPQEAEVAISIIDSYQKFGLGTLLMHVCIVAAFERNITTLRFTYLPDNHGIYRLIRKFGAFKPEHLEYDYVRVLMSLTEEMRERSLQATKDFFA